jgi:hypothetical protein
MRTHPWHGPRWLFIALLAICAGCGTPPAAKRIAADRASFDAWPADVRETVAAGRIAVGFTGEQVRMAWGEPDDIVEETTDGEPGAQWIYERNNSGFSIGFGLGGLHGLFNDDIAIRSVAHFRNGRVVAFEETGL